MAYVNAERTLLVTDTAESACGEIAGNLHFANVNMTDTRDGLKYKCNVRNVLADTIKAGSYAVINVTRGQPFSITLVSFTTIIYADSIGTTLYPLPVIYRSAGPSPTNGHGRHKEPTLTRS